MSLWSLVQSADREAGVALNRVLKDLDVESRWNKLEKKIHDSLRGVRADVISQVERHYLKVLALLLVAGLTAGVAINVISVLASTDSDVELPPVTSIPPVIERTDGAGHVVSPDVSSTGIPNVPPAAPPVEAPPVTSDWVLPAETPNYISTWASIISVIVNNNYESFPIFKHYGLTAEDMKSVLSAIVGIEDNGFGVSPTDDWGPWGIHSTNFPVGADKNDLNIQGRLALQVFADGLTATGSFEGALGYYNGGYLGPLPTYVPEVRALFEVFSKKQLTRYHVVSRGDTLYGISLAHGVPYDQIFQYVYDQQRGECVLKPIAVSDILRPGMVLAFAN